MGRPVEIETNQRYGMLIIVERSEPNNHIKHKRPYWLCRCDCGNTKIVSGQFLKKSRNPSCGCSAHLVTKNRKYSNPQDVTINSVLSNYKSKATRRKLQWELSREEFKELVMANCYFCKTPPFKNKNVYKARHSERHRASKEWSNAATIKLNGIDRLDNSKGYTPQNCVPCCEICNKAKRDLTLEEFTSWIQKLINVYQGV